MNKSFLALCSLILLSACSAPFLGNKHVEEGPIELGGLLDLSGSAQAYGEVLQKVANLRVEQWNEAGGIRGGREISIEWENGNCNAKVSELAVHHLIEEHDIHLLFGGLCSDETIGASKVTEKNKVIMVSPTSTSADITDIGDYIFRTVASDANQGKVLAKYAHAQKYKRIGVLLEKTGYTKSLLNVFKDQYDGEVFDFQVFPSSENVAGDQVKALQELGVDAIFVLAQGADAAIKSVRALEFLGWDGGLILNEVVVEVPEIREDFREYLVEREAIGSAYIIKTDTAKMKEYQDQYEERYGEKLDYLNFAASMLDAIDVSLDVLDYVEDMHDTDGIAEIMYTTQHIGYTGNITFDKNGDLRGNFTVLEFDGENFVPMEK